ncbi:hypothetical protein [Changchengzhania lutea]|uniref:hypothetical protein n=1 Tax=Changchengzhania lutea TaxID=2049305 RepID=UPI00115E228B|nr:hypothetical protein [Changchengzhania lutea]
MKKNEELFYLIKSLTKSEKRYFNLKNQANGSSRFLLVFDAIDKQDLYDEVQIKAKFKNRAFIKQFTTIKNYLKHKILNSLRNYHSQLSVQSELIDILRNVEILYNKGLYEICQSELQRAEKKAIQFQLNTLHIQIIDWKRKIHQSLFPQDWETIKRLTERQKELLSISIDYTDLILANINPEQFSISFKNVENIHHYTLYELHQYQKAIRNGNSDDEHHRLLKLIEIWEDKPDLKSEYATTYCSIVNTYLAYLTFRNQFDIAIETLNKLKVFTTKIKNQSASLIKEILRAYNIEIEIYRTQNDLIKGIGLIDEICAYINLHYSKVPKNYLLSFRFQFSHLFFLNTDYKASLKWVNIILNGKEKYHRSDLITYTYWLNLLIHFELKNVFVLRYYVDAMRRYLKKQKVIEAYEKLLLKFLSNSIDITNKKELVNSFAILHQSLEKEQISNNVLDYIDFMEWIKLKITLQKP